MAVKTEKQKRKRAEAAAQARSDAARATARAALDTESPRAASASSPALPTGPTDSFASAFYDTSAGWLLVTVSTALLVTRLVAAKVVGFGDSEALYASYALHPAAAYLDHPGLVGMFARAIGSIDASAAPLPATAHVVTALLATATPWIAAAAARAAGATWRGALAAALVVAVTPEIAIGLFAMTPDALLAPAWLVAIGAAAAGLTARPGSSRAAIAFGLAGLAAGVGAASKASGGLLFPALVIAYLSRDAVRHARSIWPWAGLAIGAVTFAPVVAFEAAHGWPMLVHRFVATQAGAGVTLRNAGAVIGGQLAYLSPVIAFVAVKAAIDLVRRRADDAVSRLLFALFVVPLGALAVLSLWSRVAEPHWLAPAFLALAVHAARRPVGAIASPRVLGWAAGVSAVMVAVVHAWVLVPAAARLAPAGSDPKYDIANELFGWPAAVNAVRDIAREEAGDLVIVGPHWVVCAQLHAALGPGVRVGCATPIRDDFDDWEPRESWRDAEKILYVTDNRFDADPAQLFPQRALARSTRVETRRGGRAARTFSISLWEWAARAETRVDFRPTQR